LSFAGIFAEVGTKDTHTLTWEVRDSGNALVAGGPAFSFTPTVEGSYTVKFTVSDDDLGVGSATRGLAVHVFEMQADLGDPTRTALVVGGTTAGDEIHIAKGSAAGALTVTLNGTALGSFTPRGGHFLVYGQAGDDDIQVNGSVSLSGWLYGDAGN